LAAASAACSDCSCAASWRAAARSPLRASPENELLSQAIDRAIGLKPKGHDFVIDRRSRRPAVARHMSVTGG